ncbi:MAG: tRNA 4-thiouridine(8) synthase ThiI [Thermodesulfobacteriota bacterium]
MRPNEKPVRALGLCSGGLDSMLAALVLRDQGIDVNWVCFETPFFTAVKAARAAAALNIPLTVRNITAEYIPMLKNPPCGYGQHMNPCLDCHALMFRIAGSIMKEKEYDFLFSGEVAGQRPMSQTKPSLRYVEKHSGFDGYIVRPLSALLLPETLPEQRGLVDRSRLLGLSGRSRKPQIALARQYGITDYPAPAGGCLLTDTNFSQRLKDLFAHSPSPAENEYLLLQYGRHFRLSPTAKLIVGRTQRENQELADLAGAIGATVLKATLFPGPTALLVGEANQGALMLAAGICVGYSKAPDDKPVTVTAVTGDHRQSIAMMAVPPDKVAHLLI